MRISRLQSSCIVLPFHVWCCLLCADLSVQGLLANPNPLITVEFTAYTEAVKGPGGWQTARVQGTCPKLVLLDTDCVSSSWPGPGWPGS